MCPSETYNRIWVGKHLSDTSCIKNGLKRRSFITTASQLCFRICHLEGSGKSGGLKLNGTHHLLVYADDVHKLDGSIYTIKKNAATLVVTSKEICLEVNAEKTKYVIMS